jgi:glutamine synthetase
MPELGEVSGWLSANRISCVRMEATNHDGLVLGKYMAPARFAATVEKGTLLADTAFGVDAAGEVAVGWDWGPWRGQVADIKLVPDPETLIALPSPEGWASAICDFTDLAGEPLPICPRGVLRRLSAELAQRGYSAAVGPELEFMVFAEPIQQARAQGYRDLTPLGGETRVTYLMSGSQELEWFMSAAMERLAALGIEWDYWSNETAPGQVEINLAPAAPLACADNVARTKQALRDVAAEEGRTVTFMAWGLDQHLGGGMHVNLSLSADGENAFYDEAAPDHHSELLRRWVAGLLATMPAAMSFLSPNPNSYRRLIEITGPPTTVSWGEGNKSVAVRTITREPHASRIEHRVPSADCNIYLALAVILAGGLVGIDDGLEPPPQFEGMAWGLPPEAAPRLPSSIKRAAAALAADTRLAEALGPETVRYWLGSREWEWMAFHTGGGDPDRVADYELRRYFEQT